MQGPASGGSSGVPPWQPWTAPAAWHQAQLQVDRRQQQAQRQQQADQRQVAAAHRHEQNNAQSRLRPAPPQSGEDAAAAQAEEVGRADSAMLGEGSSIARPAGGGPSHEGG